jgi:predicted nucleic acid-binding protein
MILADTSVWIQHFRQKVPALADLLSEQFILMHPLVAGELACGTLKNRTAILSHLNAMAQATAASNAEVLQLIEDRKLWGRGLGLIDMHLLASALLSHCKLWTLDNRLADAAKELGLWG